MKKSIMRATLPHPSVQPLVKILDPVRKAGFEGIQLGVTDPPGELTLRTPDALDGLRALKGKAEMTHLRLGLENVWNKFLMSALEARRLVEEVNSPAVGIWFDVGNVVAFAYPEQWIRLLGKTIVGVHIKDF